MTLVGQTMRHALPLLSPGQAQKEMTHNEALTLIDLLLHGQIVEVGAEIPPEPAEIGKCWILGATPEGIWEGHPGMIAGYSEGGWRFIAPIEGMHFWINEAEGYAYFSAGSWQKNAVHGHVFVAGQQIIGPRGNAIAEPSGGMVVDAEARAAITAMLVAIRTHGLIQAD